MTDYSYQLYSSRNFLPWADTFSMLSRLGYKQVEGFGPVYEDYEKISAELGNANLSMPTAHFSLEMLEEDQKKVLDIVKAFGIEVVYCPYLQPESRPSDVAGYVEFGKRLQAAGAFCRDAGLGFGWHNHDFEFVPLEDGSTPMQRIFETAPDLSWEADLAWIARGGADPLEWIEREGKRISSVHIKDIAAPGECEDEDGWADVGHGTVDWKKLHSSLQNTPVKYFIMEHDNPSDAERFAKRSIDFCKTL